MESRSQQRRTRGNALRTECWFRKRTLLLLKAVKRTLFKADKIRRYIAKVPQDAPRSAARHNSAEPHRKVRSSLRSPAATPPYSVPPPTDRHRRPNSHSGLFCPFRPFLAPPSRAAALGPSRATPVPKAELKRRGVRFHTGRPEEGTAPFAAQGRAAWSERDVRPPPWYGRGPGSGPGPGPGSVVGGRGRRRGRGRRLGTETAPLLRADGVPPGLVPAV